MEEKRRQCMLIGILEAFLWQGYWRVYLIDILMFILWLGDDPLLQNSLKAEDDFQGMKGLPGLGLSRLFRWTHQPSWKVSLRLVGVVKTQEEWSRPSEVDSWLGRNKMSVRDNMPIQQHRTQEDKISNWTPVVNWNFPQSLCDWIRGDPSPTFTYGKLSPVELD